MRDVESVSCDVVNNTVYIYDQNGNTVNVLSIPGLENAYSTGRCIIAETETMSYTYKVRRDGSMEQTGIRGRVRAPDPPSDDLIPKVTERPRRRSRSSEDCYVPSYPSSSSSSDAGCLVALVIGGILVSIWVYNAIFSGDKCGSTSGNMRQHKAAQTQRVSVQCDNSKANAASANGDLHWGHLDNGGYYVAVKGKYICKDWSERQTEGSAVFCLRKRSGKLEVYVTFSDKIVPNDLGVCGYFLGGNLAPSEIKYHDYDCCPSENNDSLFFVGDVAGLVSSMRGKNSFIVTFIDAKVGVYVGIFDITGVFYKYIEFAEGRKCR